MPKGLLLFHRSAKPSPGMSFVKSLATGLPAAESVEWLSNATGVTEAVGVMRAVAYQQKSTPSSKQPRGTCNDDLPQ